MLTQRHKGLLCVGDIYVFCHLGMLWAECKLCRRLGRVWKWKMDEAVTLTRGAYINSADFPILDSCSHDRC